MLPESNLHINDIKNVLKTNENNVNTLCVSNKINVWSKNRPIEINTPKLLSESDRQTVNFGWNIPRINNLSQWTWTTPEWEPILPSTYRRMTDFCGYQHQSTPMILHPNSIAISESNVNSSKEYEFIIGANFYNYKYDGNLSPEEINLFKPLYYGVFIRNMTTNNVLGVKTANEPIQNNNENSRKIKLKVSNLPTDDYWFYFFITDYTIYETVNSFPTTMSGYPLYFTNSFPNPVAGSIVFGISYPLSVFDIWVDLNRPSVTDNGYYQWWTNNIYEQGEYFRLDNYNSYIRLEALNTNNNPVTTSTKTWKFTTELKITQQYEQIRRKYNIISLNDVDNEKVSIMLETYSGGGLDPHILIPVIVYDSGEVVRYTNYQIESFTDEITTIEYKVIHIGNGNKRYILNIDGSTVFDRLEGSDYYQLKIEEVVMGQDLTHNEDNYALQGFYYNLRFELTGEIEY